MIEPQPPRPFVAYYRVSTLGQEQSGLGLEAQEAAIKAYLATVPGAECVERFTETESGKRNDRPQLAASIKLARKLKATLVIAKLDRLARNVHFVSGLMESGVDFVACDNPNANRLMVHMLAAFAEHEREQISERTKAGLQAAKARGQKLGVTGVIRAAENRQRADDHARSILADIRAIPDDERGNISRLVVALNERGVKTMKGGGWHRQSVYRLLNRFNDLGLEI